jgi:hypothetical protein
MDKATTLKNLLGMMREMNEIGDKYDKCMEMMSDRERDYTSVRIEKLVDWIFEGCKKITGDDNLKKHLYECIEDIEEDHENINSLELHYYTRDEWIEAHIKYDMNDKEVSMFDSLYDFMDDRNKRDWLETNYLANETNAYTDKTINFIIMAREE